MDKALSIIKDLFSDAPFLIFTSDMKHINITVDRSNPAVETYIAKVELKILPKIEITFSDLNHFVAVTSSDFIHSQSASEQVIDAMSESLMGPAFLDTSMNEIDHTDKYMKKFDTDEESAKFYLSHLGNIGRQVDIAFKNNGYKYTPAISKNILILSGVALIALIVITVLHRL